MMEKEEARVTEKSEEDQQQSSKKRKRKRDSKQKLEKGTLTEKSRPNSRQGDGDQSASPNKHKKKRQIKRRKEEGDEGNNAKSRNENNIAKEADMSGLPGAAELLKNIEINAAKSNLTTKNVKSILHHLFSDKKLLDFAKAAAQDDSSEKDFADGNDIGHRMTRSRFKKNQAGTECGFEFSKADLAEDSEDEEYQPENDSLIAVSDDDSVSTSFSDQPSPLLLESNEVIQPKTNRLEEVKTGITEDLGAEKLAFVTHTDGTLFRMPGTPLSDATAKAITEHGEEIIASRTRSKFSMKDLSLETLEASFEPPDYDPALYDSQALDEMDLDDLEWQNWLVKLVNNDEVDESMDENDDDFNFMAIEETLDEEEFRSDKGARISHKELQDLFDEVLNDFDGIMQDEGSILSCALPKLPFITWPQRLTLTAQLQQHTQLLIQSHMLTLKDPLLKKENTNSKEYMKEIVNFRQAMTSDPAIGYRSVYCFPGLDQALRILDTVDHPYDFEPIMINMDPSYKVKEVDKKARKADSIAPMPIRAGLRFFLEPYFATYRELIPVQGLLATEKLEEISKEPLRLKFFRSEDSLLALGLSQFGYDFELISQYMLPTKTPKQLKTRAKNLTSKREYENPVKIFKREKILPYLTSKVFITQPRGISMKSIKQMYYEVSQEIRLPNWMEKMHGHVKLIEDECRKQMKIFQVVSMQNLRPIAAKPLSATQSPVPFAESVDMKPVPVCPANKSPCNTPDVDVDNNQAITPEAIQVTEQITNEPLVQPAERDDCREGFSGVESSDKMATKIGPSEAAEVAAAPTSEEISKSEVTTEVTATIFTPSLANDAERETEVIECLEDPVKAPQSPTEDINNDVGIENKPIIASGLSDESGNFSCDDDAAELDDDSAAEENVISDLNSADVNNDSAVEDEIAEPSSSPAEVIDYKEIEDIENDFAKTKDSSKPKNSLRNCNHNRRKKQVRNPKFNWDEKLQEKASKFADLYFEKVKETLVDNQELYCDFLQLINEAGSCGTPKVKVYEKLVGLFKEIPDLAEMFVGFLEPGEAREVGKFKTWLEFDRARNFLLSCEANFMKTKHYHQLLRKIVKLHETEKNSKKVVESITPLFRGNQHLIAEFGTFFPDLPPPKCRGEDFEIIEYRPEDGGFDYVDEFEEVKLMVNEGDNEDPVQRKPTILDNLAAWLQKPALNSGESKSDKAEGRKMEVDVYEEKTKNESDLVIEKPNMKDPFAKGKVGNVAENDCLDGNKYYCENDRRIESDTEIDLISDLDTDCCDNEMEAGSKSVLIHVEKDSDSGESTSTSRDLKLKSKHTLQSCESNSSYILDNGEHSVLHLNEEQTSHEVDSTIESELGSEKRAQANIQLSHGLKEDSSNIDGSKHEARNANPRLDRTPVRAISSERLPTINLDQSPSGTKLNRFRIDVNNLEQKEGFHQISTPYTDTEIDATATTSSVIPHVEKFSRNEDQDDCAKEAGQISGDEREAESEESDGSFEEDEERSLNALPAGDLHYDEVGDIVFKWTRDDDRFILMTCQQKGPSDSTFTFIADQLTGRTKNEVQERFVKLMELYNAAKN